MADTPTPAAPATPLPDVPAGFVTVVAKSTGRKQHVPPHFLELAKAGVPGFDFELPPSTRTVREPATVQEPATPATSTVKESTDAS